MPIRYDFTKDSLYLEGMEIGRKIGIEKGRKIGRKMGRKIGRKIARKEVKELKKWKTKFYIKLLKLFSIKVIAEHFGVSKKYLRKLKKKMKKLEA